MPLPHQGGQRTSPRCLSSIFPGRHWCKVERRNQVEIQRAHSHGQSLASVRIPKAYIRASLTARTLTDCLARRSATVRRKCRTRLEPSRCSPRRLFTAAVGRAFRLARPLPHGHKEQARAQYCRQREDDGRRGICLGCIHWLYREHRQLGRSRVLRACSGCASG